MIKIYNLLNSRHTEGVVHIHGRIRPKSVVPFLGKSEVNTTQMVTSITKKRGRYRWVSIC